MKKGTGFIYKPPQAGAGAIEPNPLIRLPPALLAKQVNQTTSNSTENQGPATKIAPVSPQAAPTKPRGFHFKLPFPLVDALERVQHVSATSIPSLRFRGFINRDNKCFLNVVIQSMIATPPFYNFINAISVADESDAEYPTISRFIRFLRESQKTTTPSRSAALDVAGPGGKVNPWAASAAKAPKPAPQPADALQIGPPMLPEMFYDLLKRFNPIASDWQEDSQEFFSFLLDVMHDELIHVAPSNSKEHHADHFAESAFASDEWEEVGKKNKSAVVLTERSSFPQSIITEIFGGELRSIVKKQGGKASASIQPFFCLHLDISDAAIATIDDAMRLYMTSEKLDYFLDEKTRDNLIATKQNAVDKLPRVLTLHLKRFAYNNYGQIEKVSKQVFFSPTLKFQPSWLVHEKKYSQAERTYKLFAVVSHWGPRAVGGHYTCSILSPNGSGWLNIDDSNVTRTTESEVLQKPAYLLMYIRSN